MPSRQPRKKALLIGINYYKQQGELRGCINDVKNLKVFLLENGFQDDPSHMVVLTDDGKSSGLPTKNNIISAILWLVHDNQPGDVLFFHYSGHGGQAKDISGDEADGTDETLYPVDYNQSGHIVDDDLHTALVKTLKAGVRLISIFDCCHSGTALDLPYTYSPDGGYEKVTGAVVEDTDDKKDKKKWKGFKLKKGSEKKQHVNSSPAQIIMISGCRDDQTSADATIGGEATGAMSFALMLELKAEKSPTLIQLLNGMRKILKDKRFAQIPQMSTGHEMDPETVFSLDI